MLRGVIRCSKPDATSMRPPLPPSLTLNSDDAAIEGTRTQLGSYMLQLTAIDSQGDFAFASVRIVVAPEIAIASPDTLPPAPPGPPYAVQLTASGGATP